MGEEEVFPNVGKSKSLGAMLETGLAGCLILDTVDSDKRPAAMSGSCLSSIHVYTGLDCGINTLSNWIDMLS